MVSTLERSFHGGFHYEPEKGLRELAQALERAGGPAQSFGLICGGSRPSYGLASLARPTSNLPVGSLQTFLDGFLKEGGAEKVDYVHGEEIVDRLGRMPGNAGFLLPAMDKGDLFKTVLLDGALPRKTFSMGEAHEKRFYMEAHPIT